VVTIATRSLNVVITGDSKGIGIAAREADGHLRVVQRSAKATGTALKVGFGVAAGGVLIGVGALKKSVKAAEEAQASTARLKAQLKASGISYRAHAKEIDAVIQKHSKLAGIDDEDLQDAFTNLVRSTGSVKKAMHDMGLVTDLARAKHIDVTKAADLLGKVHAGNTGILKRYGIALDPVTKAQDRLKESNKHATVEQIKAAKATDKQAASQQAIAELQKRFGGQAEAYGKTAAGAQERFGVALENVEEKIGAGLLPVLAKGANAVATFLQQIESGKGAGGALAKGISTAFTTIKTVIGTVVTAVKGYLATHRADIANVITAFKRVAQFARQTWQETLLPIVKRTVAAIGPIVRGLVDVIRGIVRLVSGLLSGNWSKAWSGAKEAASGATRAIVTLVKTMASNLWDLIKGLGPKLVSLIVKGIGNVGKAIAVGLGQGLGNLGHLILDKLKGAWDWVKSHLHLPSIKLPFGIGGDGPGRGGTLPSGGAFGGSLMGARSSLRPFAAIGSRFGLSVSDGKRPAGTRTASGGISYHSTGEAIDMADGRGPDSNKLGFFKYLKSRFGGQLAELIYTPGGKGIKDGRPFQYTGAVAADHFDHVHVAFDSGRPGVGDGHGRFKGDGLGQLEQLWMQAGGPRSSAATAAAVAMAESSGNPSASNRNSNGTIDRGLWQINSTHGALSTFDPAGNARAAVKLSRYGGSWAPWSVYKSGAYRRYLDGARRVLATIGGSGKNAKIKHGSSTVRVGHYDPASPYSGDDTAGTPAELAGFKLARSGRVLGAGLKGVVRSDGTQAGVAAPPAAAGPDGDPNQPLIDALAADAAAQQALADQLAGVRDELKRQTDFAASVANTSNFQLTKGLADLVSGRIVGYGVAGRAFTPGIGVEHAY
jgi:hypothetical protein